MESLRYYILDWQQLSYREHLALSPGWRGLKRWLAISFGNTRQPPVITSFTPMLGRLKPVSQLPHELQPLLAPWLTKAVLCGFQEIGAVEIENPFSAAQRYRVALRHTSGYAGLVLSCHLLPGSPGQVFPTLLTRLDDQGWVRTQSMPALRPPPMGRDFLSSVPSLETFWERHKLNVTSIRSAEPAPFVDHNDFVAFSDRVDSTELEWHRARGVFCPLSPQRASVLRARAQSERQQRLILAPGGAECHPIHHALARSPHPTPPSLTGTVMAAAATWVLLGTLGKWEWSEAGPILFLALATLFHEAGHRAGRWIEKRYESPLTPYVELFMGPLPGLFLGTFLLLATPFSRWGLSLALLNLLTLLPIPPMDGARFFRLAIFSHHPWIAPAVNSLLIGILVIAGWLTGSWMPAVAALFLMLLLPAQVRLAHLAPLVRMHFGNPDQPLKPEATLSLVTAIREVFPNGNNPDFLLAMARRLYQLGRVRPPSGRQTFHLSALYGMALLLPGLVAGSFLLRTPVLTQLAETPPLPPRAVQPLDEEDLLPVRRAIAVEAASQTAGDAMAEALRDITPPHATPRPSGNALDEALREVAAVRPAPTISAITQPSPQTTPRPSGNALDEALHEVAAVRPAPTADAIPRISPQTASRPSGNALDEALQEVSALRPRPAGNALEEALQEIRGNALQEALEEITARPAATAVP